MLLHYMTKLTIMDSIFPTNAKQTQAGYQQITLTNYKKSLNN